jgi:hypothetical protein
LLQEATVSHLVKRLSKAVGSHVLGSHMLEHNIPVFDLILDVVVVNIDMFGALMMTLACDKLDGGLVVTVELDRAYIVALVVNLFNVRSQAKDS